MQNESKGEHKVKHTKAGFRGELNYIELGNRIKVERENFGMNREELSVMLCISTYNLGEIERGQRKLSINTLINISECLHISVDYLIFEIVNNEPKSNNNVLHTIINKCSEKEVKVIESMIKFVLPHLAR
jgi:transcriptional regulator with XRE-family HTH domain